MVKIGRLIFGPRKDVSQVNVPAPRATDVQMPFLIDNNYADMGVMAKAAAQWYHEQVVKAGTEDLEELAKHLGQDFEQLCRVRKLIRHYIQAAAATEGGG